MSAPRTQIFVNLPVADLPRSMAFFEGLGFHFNRQFTDETAACMVISEEIHAMLLTHPKFQGFIPKGISDAHQTTEVLLCVSRESRQAVDDLMTRALAAGAKALGEPQDHGFMYYRSMQDLDGHIWEWMHLTPTT